MNFMKEIKQRKERRFLKTLGRVGEILVEQVLLKLGSSIIKKIGGKKTLPSILFLLASLSLFAQYPATGNKQRLGFQTTGDGLVYRGRAADTVAIKSSGLNNAYFILDTVNNIQYNYIKTKGGWVFSNGDTIIINNNFTQPVDSLFFNVNVPTNNVDTAKMRWDSDLATVVLGLNDNVPNELGFKNFWLVKNQTGSTITKGSIVYANGTVGASGRITVDKFIANGSIDAKYLLGITAHDLTDGEDGYVISFGKIRQVNTDTFAAGAILYPSPTVAGVWTDVEPVAPNIDMPIGFCINSSVNNGTIAIRVASGYKLSELHDVQITSPVEKASLYYSNGLWRDTTAVLLVSDTASMLTNYLRTGVATSTYLTQSNAASTYLPLTGGILTGGLTGTTAIFNTSLAIGYPIAYKPLEILSNPNDFVSIAVNALGQYQWSGIHFGYREANSNYRKSSIVFQRNDVGVGDASGKIHILNVSPFNGGKNADLSDARMTINSNGYIGVNDTTPSHYLDVNGTFNANGNSLIGGTLGVTGAATLSAPLTVNSSAVFNEGSADSDFRVESDGNANMVFVDASTDRVGIGTNAPTRTLEVNGTVGVSSNVTANSFIKSGGSFTQFLKADGTVDGNDYLTTSSAGSTYLPLTGGTLTGGLTGTTALFSGNVAIGFPFAYKPLEVLSNANDFVSVGVTNLGQFQWSGIHFGYREADVVYRKSAIVFQRNDVGIGDASGKIHILNVNSGNAGRNADLRDAKLTIGNNGFVGINDTSPSFNLDITGTLNATGAATLGSTLAVTGATTLSTTTATPISLLGKDNSNVVGTVTTVAQTGLMTRGETTATTGSPSAIFTVTHGLGSTPTSVLVTSAGLAGAEKIIFEVYSKNSTTFSVQAWNYDGTEASSKSVKIFWLAIK